MFFTPWLRLEFEGWILLRTLLGMAVRSFWNDLEKLPKSASREILGGWVNILAWGHLCANKWSGKKLFCGGMILCWGF